MFQAIWEEYGSVVLSSALGVAIAVLVSVFRKPDREIERANRGIVSKIGKIRAQISSQEALLGDPVRFNAINQSQFVMFSFFSALAALIAYIRDLGSINGFKFLDILIVACAISACFAIAALWNVWTTSHRFMNFAAWKKAKERQIAELQRKHIKLVPYQPDESEKFQSAASGPDDSAGVSVSRAFDPVQKLLSYRKPVRFDIAKELGKIANGSFWEVGLVVSVGGFEFGFIRPTDSKARAVEDLPREPELYFQFKDVCNQVRPKVGDLVYYVPVERVPAKKNEHAFLICLHGEKLRGIVLHIGSNGGVFVQITDGSNNFATIFVAANQTVGAEKMNSGDRVEGHVSNNGVGVTLYELRRIV